MKDKENEEPYFEPLFRAIGRAQSDADDILKEYYFVRLRELYESIKEKIKRSEEISSEKSEKLKEIIIPKLEELIKLTRPNVVDNTILEITSGYIDYSIKPEDPEPDYLNTLQKSSKSLDLLIKDGRYYLQNMYSQILHGKLTPQSFYPYFNEMREFAYKVYPNPDEEYIKYIEFDVRKTIAERCIREIVYDLLKNPDKHQQLIKEGRYIETSFSEFCSK